MATKAVNKKCFETSPLPELLVQVQNNCLEMFLIMPSTKIPQTVLSLNGGYTSLSESTLVKMFHCWKSHVTAQKLLKNIIHMKAKKHFKE